MNPWILYYCDNDNYYHFRLFTVIEEICPKCQQLLKIAYGDSKKFKKLTAEY